MKFFIVLLAVVAAASAGYVGHGHGETVVHPWEPPAALVHAPVYHSPAVHAPAPWVAPAPKYAKVAHPHVEQYHVSFVPGHTVGPVVPGPHPKPISYHGNEHVNKIHWNGNTAGHPHLVGVEHYVAHEEPAIAVVKTHGHGHGW